VPKDILIVGEHFYRDDWKLELERAGFTCHEAPAILDAINYLQSTPGSARFQLLVQENAPITPSAQSNPGVPAEFKSIKPYDAGSTFITYARSNGLINSDVPAYLATIANHDEKYAIPPDGITKVIRLESRENIVSQMQPELYRPAAVDTLGKE
jgi:hypothetical protein